MLLVCPSCRTRYIVPDNAIGVDGRQVRCANCKHGWFQEGAVPLTTPAPSLADPSIAAPAEQSGPAPGITPPEAARPMSAAQTPSEYEEPSGGAPTPATTPLLSPDPVPRLMVAETDADDARSAFPRFAAERAAAPGPAPVDVDPSLSAGNWAEKEPTQSRFAHEPPFNQRRSRTKIWTLAAIIFALTVTVMGTAISYFGMPDIGLSSAAEDSALTIVVNENLQLNERDDGTPYFIASGSIVNPTGVKQNVPEMLVTLKDASGRPVYSWKMKAKARTLAPGAKVDFSEARLDVPLAAKDAVVGWVRSGD